MQSDVEMCAAQCVRKWLAVRGSLFDAFNLEVSIKCDAYLVGTECSS